MLKTTVKDGITYAKVADLFNWSENPKDVVQEDMERLLEQIKLGEHSAMLVTADGEVLGGNTRLRAYQQLKKSEAKVIIVDFDVQDDGVHAVVDGVAAHRVFDTLGQAKLEYALSHNDMIGSYNQGKLAELLVATPIPLNMYKVATVANPVEKASFESIYGTSNELDDALASPQDTDTYLDNTIKQIVLFFSNEVYEDIVPRMEQLRKQYEVSNNTDLFLCMLRDFE